MNVRSSRLRTGCEFKSNKMKANRRLFTLILLARNETKH